MASKCNDANSIEGASTEPSMDYLSTDLASLTVATRKAEVSTMALDSAASENVDEEEDEEEEDDDEEEDEEEEEEEEEEEDSCESDQEWEVDSFEGVEYHSDEEDDDLEFRRYVRQCYKGEGFDVDREFLPKSKTRIYFGFNPVELDEYFGPPELTGRMYMERMVKVVIEKFNETKGKKLVLDHIVKTVVKMDVGVKAYITFMARESLEGELVEYQGKAEWKVWQRNIHPILCRPTPKPENAN